MPYFSLVKKLKWVLVALVMLVVGGYTATQLFKHHIRLMYTANLAGAPYDVVIVPGLPYDTPVPNNLFKARMLWAKTLYDKGVVKHIIYSGAAVHTPYIEGCVMKDISALMGIPPECTFAETKAEHTVNNVDEGLKLARSLGFKRVAVATDPFQTVFLKRHIDKNKIPVALLPFSLEAYVGFEKTPFPKFNAEHAFVQGFVPLKERGNR